MDEPRSESIFSFSRLRKENFSRAIGLYVTVFLQSFVMFGPLGTVFDIQDVSLETQIFSSGIMAVSVLVIAEFYKIITRIYLSNA